LSIRVPPRVENVVREYGSFLVSAISDQVVEVAVDDEAEDAEFLTERPIEDV
jgi:hypothetical protein